VLLIHKILPLLLLPPGLCVVLIVGGLVFRRRVLLWLGVIVLWVSSMPVVGDALMRQVEGGSGRISVSAINQADAIVVLSGMVEQVAGAPYGEWGEAADRFDGGVELYRAGKAPVVVFTGGQLPWQKQFVPEGELLARRAILSGVPESAIRISGIAGNTEEEAVAVRRMLKGNRIVLVTSAYHMPRSVALFEQAGFTVEPYPVDFRVSGMKRLTVLDFLPSADGLEQSVTALRELMGRGYYFFKGLMAG